LNINSIEFVICPHCSFSGYIEDYPTLGEQVCAECGHESEKIRLKIIDDEKEISDTCPFCGKEGEEDDTFFEDDDILVFKCKKCGKLDGYEFSDFPEFDCGFEGTYDSFSIKIANQEGKYVHPASKCREFEKALRKRENDPIEKCKKHLDYLIYSQRYKLLNLGISREIIDVAICKTKNFINLNGTQSDKKLNCLFPAALLVVSENKLTERQLEKIFPVTRKTIRKWKEILKNSS